MQFEAVVDLAGVEVPEDDFCDLSGEGVLCAGEVPAVPGDLYGWVVRTVHEIL